MSVHSKAPNAEKGRRYLAQLDQALCNGNWADVPELARKTDKHAPERACTYGRATFQELPY
jgi:cargo-transport protein YPP1